MEGQIEGWMEQQRGRREQEGGEVVVSAGGWVGGLFCHI